MEKVRRMRPLLGTFVEVQAEGAGAHEAMDAAWRVLEKAQRDWSVQDASSELSRINASHGCFMRVQPQTFRLLRLSCALMRQSGGAFDITVGGMLTEAGVLPEQGVRWLPRGHIDDIDLLDGAVRLRRPLRLTLDGVAKGYAVDLAVSALRRAGVRAGWINAGGDVRVFGETAVPLLRRVDDGALVPMGALRQAAVATSLVQAPQCEPDERWPAHIVAPVASAPEPGVWTVMARSAWRADALTKVAAVCAEHQRATVIQQLGGCLLDDVAVAGMHATPESRHIK